MYIIMWHLEAVSTALHHSPHLRMAWIVQFGCVWLKKINLWPAFQPCRLQKQPLLGLVPLTILSSVVIYSFMAVFFTVLVGYPLQKTCLVLSTCALSEVQVYIDLLLFGRFSEDVFFFFICMDFLFSLATKNLRAKFCSQLKQHMLSLDLLAHIIIMKSLSFLLFNFKVQLSELLLLWAILNSF